MVADFDFGDVDIERDIVEGAGFRLESYQCKSEEEVIANGQDAQAILVQYAPVGATAIDNLPQLRVISRYGTGVDIVDVDAATRHGIQVTNAPNDWCAEEVADHAVALWLCAARKIIDYHTATRQGEWRWQTGQPIWRLRGRIFGLLGYGAIARLIAARAQAFGVAVWAHDPFADPDRLKADNVRPVSFNQLVTGSDYLTIQTPLTSDTYLKFDDETLARMKPTAILINTARGPIIDDAALDRALTQGTIAAAALDDLLEEPSKQRDWRPDNPLLRHPRAIVTPHAAYYSEQSVHTIRTIAAEEAVRYLSGRPPHSPVNRIGA
jgi:D-3-phosphoglycerate dehydrogenase